MDKQTICNGLIWAIAYAISQTDDLGGTVWCEKWDNARRAMEQAIKIINEQEPVKRARWITYPECLGYDGAYHDEHIVCSACHSVWNIIDNDTERFDHCPACGAKMDGERREPDA